MLFKFREVKMLQRQSVLLSSLMVACLLGLCTRHALAAVGGSNVYLTGVVCKAEIAAFRSSKAEPDVYIDYSGNNAKPNTLTSYGRSQYSFSLSLVSAPGFHQLFILSQFGSASAYADILPGRDRHLTVSICNGLAHFDDLRTLSVELPNAGLTAYAIIQRKNGREFVPLLTDDQAAYGFGLGEGHITLVVGYSNDLPKCLYEINVPDSPAVQQHIRVVIDEASLASVDLNAAQVCKLKSMNITDGANGRRAELP